MSLQRKRMKNLTNILSYLWLLLLMAVTACSDLEEEVGPMHVEEEVELTIQLHVPDMQASTREEMVITENISSIVAIAFDESGDLIKKVDAILSDQDHENHSGTLKIKVPKRTQTIHFLGNYTKNDIESITSLETLNSFTTNDVTTMRYWGKAEYNGGNNLSVTLHRNMAKLTLKKGDGFTANSCYIAGFVNRNLSGTIVPSGYAVGDTPTIPNGVTTHTYTADNSLGNVYYLFEHANVENSNPLYVIIEVAAKYYKVAFAAGDEYFPIIRNHEYTITIDGIDAMYAENNYTDAVNSQYPINDLVITSVPMTVTASPTEVLNESNQTFTVTVTIPEGITELNVPTHDAFDITPPNSLTPQNGKYTVTQGNYEFTFTVKEGVEAGDKTISFSGRGKYKSATGSATVTLEDKKTVSIVAVPSATTLNYAASSVEDLLVNVTIQKEVTGLTFSSSDFTIKVVGNELQPTEGVYPITHDENATETTIPVRIRLNDGVDKETASFTFDGTSNDANVEVQEDTKEITLTAADDANVRWQGNVPLNGNVYANIVPLMYDWFLDGNNFIPVGSKLNLEFTVTGDNTSWLEVFEICGDTENDWNNPVHQFAELNNSNRYTANGNNTLSLTLSEATFNKISENFRNDFLGETGDENKIAMAIRGTGITLTKVSVLPPPEELPTVAITAIPYVNSLNYSTNSVSDLIVNVTIPKEVSTLTFASEYFDAAVVVDTLLTAPTNGTYTVVHPNNGNDPTSTSVRLRLKNKTSTTSAGFTFSGTGENVTVTSAVIDNITLTEGGDEYVRWQGDAALQWGINAVQIPLLYSWFYDANNQLIIPVGSTLRVEYETLGNDASIQFAECNGTWNDDAYYFSELHAEYNNNGNNETMGLNLDNNTGIYNGTSKDLVLTQAVLDNMKENRTNLLGENDIVMAIQGGNVTLKKISVIPATENPNNPLSIELDFYADSENLGNGATYSNLALNSSHFYLKATVTGDLSAYHGQPVQLQGAFSSPYQYSNSNEAIHWTNSRQTDSSISYYGERIDGKGLQFTIDSTKDVYIIDWVFQTGSLYTGYGDIQFTYTLSNNQGHSITGDTSATIAFTNEPVGIVLLNSQHQFETQDNGYWTSLTFDGPFPIGTKIILTFSEGGGIKLCDGSNNNLYVPAFASNNLYGNGGNSDLWMTAPTGNLVLDITEDIILYGKGTGTNNGNLSANNPLNSFIIESGETVLDKVVVVYPEGYVEEEEVIVNIDFRTYNQWTLWCQPDDESASNYRKPTVDSQNGFCLSNPEKCSESEGWLPQYHLANGLTLETGTYKITMKIRGSVAGQIDRVGLGSWDTGQTYSSSAMTFTTAWQENTVEVEVEQATAQGAGFVMCQSGSFIGDLYIQTLKVVRSD